MENVIRIEAIQGAGKDPVILGKMAGPFCVCRNKFLPGHGKILYHLVKNASAGQKGICIERQNLCGYT